MALAIGAMLFVLGRQRIVPSDTLLGNLPHAALAAGIVAASKLAGQRLDLMGYLFGDVLAVGPGRTGLGALRAAVWSWRRWPGCGARWWRSPSMRNWRLAEGLDVAAAEAVLVLLLALGHRHRHEDRRRPPHHRFPGHACSGGPPVRGYARSHGGFAAIIGAVGAAAGLGLSMAADIPGGPAIVLVLSAASMGAIFWSALRGAKG